MEQTITPGTDNQIFSALPRASVAQQALESIRQAIINGDLRPRQALRETDIASQMGISRAPVREALLMLEESGLVEWIPHKGTFVAPFSRKDVEEVYSLRVVLECFGIDLLIEHLEDEDIHNLRAIMNKMRQAVEENDEDRVNDYDLEFHEYMIARSGHKRLLDAWHNLKFQIRRIVIAANILNEDLHKIVENHMPVLNALEARDAAKAKQHVRQHILDSGERFVANWEWIQSSVDSREYSENAI